jgi:hypothetical protein
MFCAINFTKKYQSLKVVQLIANTMKLDFIYSIQYFKKPTIITEQRTTDV